MVEDESGEQQPMSPFIEPPEDLYALYMMTRAEISSSKNFFQYYMKLTFLIDVGKEMLPDEYQRLREEAERVLCEVKSYPETRQMEFTNEGLYRMGTGTNSTGLIHVRSEDLSVALEEVKNQQATTLIPTLKKLDSRIFKALIDAGVIEVKKPSMEDLMMQDIMMGIQKRLSEGGVESAK